jgi:hypothetical protein
MSLSTYLAPGSYVNVLVMVQSNTADMGLSIAGDAGFTFHPSGEFAWNKAQTVTIVAKNNDMIDGARNGTLQHVVSATDPNYVFSNTGVKDPTMTVTVTDNDVPVGLCTTLNPKP